MTNERFSEKIISLARRMYPYLENNCVGAENAKTHEALFDAMLYYWSYGDKFTKRQMRRALKAMLRVLNYPVISSGNGVFIATEQEDIDAFAAVERSRAAESFANATAAERVSPGRFHGYGVFEFARKGK